MIEFFTNYGMSIYATLFILAVILGILCELDFNASVGKRGEVTTRTLIQIVLFSIIPFIMLTLVGMYVKANVIGGKNNY